MAGGRSHVTRRVGSSTKQRLVSAVGESLRQQNSGRTQQHTRAASQRASSIDPRAHKSLPEAELLRELEADELAAGVSASVSLVQLRRERGRGARRRSERPRVSISAAAHALSRGEVFPRCVWLRTSRHGGWEGSRRLHVARERAGPLATQHCAPPTSPEERRRGT